MVQKVDDIDVWSWQFLAIRVGRASLSERPVCVEPFLTRSGHPGPILPVVQK